MGAGLAAANTITVRLSTKELEEEECGAVEDFIVPCSSRKFLSLSLYCSWAPSVCNLLTFVSHASYRLARACRMTSEASAFVCIQSSIVHLVPASIISRRCLLPQMSARLNGAVLSEDTASSGA